MQGSQQILKLRPSFDREKQATNIKAQKSIRHKVYLKDMLVNKFLAKHHLDPSIQLVSHDSGKAVDQQKLYKVQMMVNQEFDKFIDQQSFTQKNLHCFESDLKGRVDANLKKEGIEIPKSSLQNQIKTIETSQTLPPKSGRNVRSKYGHEMGGREMGSKNVSLPKIHTGRHQELATEISINETHFKKSKLLHNNHAYSNIVARNRASQPPGGTTRHVSNMRKVPSAIQGMVRGPNVSSTVRTSLHNMPPAKPLPNVRNSQPYLENEKLKYDSLDIDYHQPLDLKNKGKRIEAGSLKGQSVNRGFHGRNNNRLGSNGLQSNNDLRRNPGLDNPRFSNQYRSNNNLTGIQNPQSGFKQYGNMQSMPNLNLNTDVPMSRQRNTKISADYQHFNTREDLPTGQQILKGYNSQLHGEKKADISQEKQFADLRVKMGDKRSPDKHEVESLPSDISDDMWGELPKFQHMKYLEQLKKEKDDREKKKNLIRQTLDQQIIEQRKKKQQEIEKIKRMDQEILKNAKSEIEKEQEKKEQHKVKVQAQKEQRDKMLKEAKAKRQNDFKDIRQKELEEVLQLKHELEKEKKDKIEKKMKQRQIAQKVIKENEQEKEKRVKEKEVEKEKQQKIIEEYNRMLDAQDKKRADEWAAREAKIKNAMSKMADTVLRKNNEMEKEMERRAVQYANEKDQKDELKERKKKEAIMKRDMEIRKTLDRQIEDKKKAQKQEQENNKKFVQMVIERDEKDRRDQREKKERNFQKQKELQRYQRLQMGELTHEDGDHKSMVSSIRKTQIGGKKQILLGGPMSQEEIRMNKGLLKEISIMKKQSQAQDFSHIESSPEAEAKKASELNAY